MAEIRVCPLRPLARSRCRLGTRFILRLVLSIGLSSRGVSRAKASLEDADGGSSSITVGRPALVWSEGSTRLEMGNKVQCEPFKSSQTGAVKHRWGCASTLNLLPPNNKVFKRP